MNLLGNINIDSRKLIGNEQLIRLRGGDEEDRCCFIFCPGGVYCGKKGENTSCEDVPMPDGCEDALEGSCSNCSMLT